MNIARVEVPYGAHTLTIETGKYAKQANGAAWVTCGGTVVLVTACIAKSIRAGIDFFPLSVDYEERLYAAGRIPGSWFRREGRPADDGGGFEADRLLRWREGHRAQPTHWRTSVGQRRHHASETVSVPLRPATRVALGCRSVCGWRFQDAGVRRRQR